jgi:cytosine/creatinine deaminase
MLVLARQRDETIMIGDDIEVTVVDIRGDKVRLGINAPRSVSVHRKEIYDAIRLENRESAKLRPQDMPDLGKGKPPVAPVQMKLVGAEQVDRAAHEPFLRAAIEEARLGMSEGGLPIGSVLVRGGQIVSRGHNRRVQNGNPMAHAEIDALTQAGRQKSYRDTVLYSTLMPCYLCSGAAVQFGVPRVVVGESVNFPGAGDFMRSRGIDVIDLHDPECIQMMADFIRAHPELWNEDIGK